MSRRLPPVAALALVASTALLWWGAGPAGASPPSCSVDSGVLTVSFPDGSFIVELTYVSASDALVAKSNGEQVACASGAFSNLTEVVVAASIYPQVVTLKMGRPWTNVAEQPINVDLDALASLSVLDVQLVAATDPLLLDTDVDGLSINGGDDPAISYAGLATLYLTTGGGDDTFIVDDPTLDGVRVEAGAGADFVTATSTSGLYVLGDDNDSFLGGIESDLVYPGDGADEVGSGGGEDVIGAEPDGAVDTIDGGGDATFQALSDEQAMQVSDNGIADDGLRGGTEFDNYFGLQAVNASGGNDRIDLAGIEEADAGAGDDLVIGTSGPRTVSGGTGFNTLDLSTLPGAVEGDVTGLFGSVVTPGGVIEHASFSELIGTLFADELAATCSSCVVEPHLGNDLVTLSNGGTFRASAGADGRDTVAGNGIASYALRSAPVNVSLDVAADAPRDDGATGELDDIRSSGIVGGSGNDALSGDGAANRIDGSGGNDVILGRGGADTLRGDAGVDSVNGNNGNDEVRGGADNDTVRGGDGDDAVYGDETGQDFADTIDGGQGDDDEYGRGGDDTFLQGGNGFGNGSDVIDGGGGVDTVSYLGRTSGISASINALFDDGAAGEGDQIRANVESLAGSNGDDVLTGAAAANTLLGNGGNDKLDGRGGDDIVRGGPGDDQFIETTAANGADSYFGDDGFDTVTYLGRTAGVSVTKDALANDGANSGAEGDYVRADVEKVIGTSFADALTGGGIDDWFYGGGGNDTLTGKAGADTLFGDAGDDTFFARDNKADTLDGGAGNDSSQHDAIDIRTLIEVTLP
ncbi:calcium-binding protein [Nocardioides humilatus]|uniref:Calcium-binding protein n=1 Tax=Nocardioides humilatus TaxID=2607660 RepID=A0A5B1LNJ0_9ACTN|nr:calcium-binding protein [Nocardioides humilatus]KAA1421678.1 calcium-binding protein [Nocardioides humilatus]